MRAVMGLALVLSLGCASGPTLPPREEVLRPEGGPVLAQIAARAAAARAEGYLPVVNVSARWCWPCEVIHRNLSQPPLSSALDGVALLVVDADAWAEVLPSVGLFAGRIPALYRLDAQDRPLSPPLTGDWDNPADAAAMLRPFVRR